jgi:hypothetical protein
VWPRAVQAVAYRKLLPVTESGWDALGAVVLPRHAIRKTVQPGGAAYCKHCYLFIYAPARAYPVRRLHWRASSNCRVVVCAAGGGGANTGAADGAAAPAAGVAPASATVLGVTGVRVAWVVYKRGCYTAPHKRRWSTQGGETYVRVTGGPLRQRRDALAKATDDAHPPSAR